MKYMIEFQIKPGLQDQAIERFELNGPNRNPGVHFRGAWIGRSTGVVFVLSDSADVALIEQVCQSWSEYGEYKVHPVVDVEQY